MPCWEHDFFLNWECCSVNQHIAVTWNTNCVQRNKNGSSKLIWTKVMVWWTFASETSVWQLIHEFLTYHNFCSVGWKTELASTVAYLMNSTQKTRDENKVMCSSSFRVFTLFIKFSILFSNGLIKKTWSRWGLMTIQTSVLGSRLCSTRRRCLSVAPGRMDYELSTGVDEVFHLLHLN